MNTIANPLYQFIYDQLRREIAEQVIAVGQKLPPEPRLAERFNVSVGTIRQAVGLLVQQGVVNRQQGRGTVVIKTEPTGAFGKEGASDSRIPWGYARPLLRQQVLDQKLWGPHHQRIQPRMLRSFNEPLASLPESWRQCAVLQLSTFDLHQPAVAGALQAVPADIQESAKKCFAPDVLDQCSSLDGQLLMLPIMANPTVCFAHRQAFEQAGLTLPTEGWSWAEFVETCRAFQAVGDWHLGLWPVWLLIFEPFLWSHGGAFFDDVGRVSLQREPFEQAFARLHGLFDEDLAWDMYEMGRTPWRYLRDRRVALTFMSPHLTVELGEQIAEWSLLPLPQQATPITPTIVFGLTVPQGHPQADAAWDLLRDLLNDGHFADLGQLPMLMPAHLQGQKKWTGNGVGNPAWMRQSLAHSRYVPTRKGFMRWQAPVYRRLIQAMHGEIAVDAAWREIREHLEAAQFREQETLLLA